MNPAEIFTICGCGTRGPLQKIMQKHSTPEDHRCMIDQKQRQG